MVVSISIGLMVIAGFLALLSYFLPDRRILPVAVVVLAIGTTLAHVPITQ